MYLSSYEKTLKFALLRLRDEHALVSPTVIQGVLESINRPPIVTKPWEERDDLALGSAMINEARSKMPKIRKALHEEGVITVPVTKFYYDMGFGDGEAPRDIGQTMLSVPVGFYKTAGIRFATTDDVFFLTFEHVILKRAVNGTSNAAALIKQAIDAKILPGDKALPIITASKAALNQLEAAEMAAQRDAA